MMVLRSLLVVVIVSVFTSCGDGNKKQESAAIADTLAVEEQAQIVPVKQGKHVTEDSIGFYLSEIRRIRYENDDYDKLDNINRILVQYMKRVCMDASALQYNFEGLRDSGMMVLTSDDRKFRIYCWDTETGGTMHFYNAIAQYKTSMGSDKYVLNDIAESAEEGGDCGYWYSELHIVQASGNKTYYLPIYYGRYSGIEHANGIGSYSIEGDKLNTDPLIFKPKGKALSDIIYDFTSGTMDKESSDNRIALSADKKTLSIPITDKDRVVTDKSLIYKFDGDKFVYDKNAR